MSDTPKIPADVALCLSYSDGMFLTAQNMTLEASYYSNWITWQNRFLYTPGVLSGLAVTLENNTLVVASGAAIDSLGDFLIFPDGSGNRMTPASDRGDTYGLYLVYPAKPAPTQQPGVVNTAAVLQNGPAQNGPANGVILATVTLDSTNPPVIKSIADSRVGVTSRLPIVIAPANVKVESVAPDLNGARHGTKIVDTTSLLKPGDSTKAEVVPYLPDGSPAFTMPPRVVATVAGATPYAVAIHDVGTAQFMLTLTALQTRVDGTPSAQVNWIALS
ncbi:hypothetical protein AAHK20_01235 [Trinickia sp. YCB016]